MSMHNYPRDGERPRSKTLRYGTSTAVMLYEPRLGVPGGAPRSGAPPPSTDLEPFAPGAHADWNGIWLASQSRDWHAFAILPADDGIPTMPVGQLVKAISARHGQDVIHVADLRGVQLQHTNAYLEVLRWHMYQGERVVLVLRSCFENPATPLLARAADCALLCVTMGTTRRARAAQTVDMIGKERFLGSVVVNVFEEDPIVLPKNLF